MVDRGAAERACKDANPIIDGRKANVNLAYLGAKPRSSQTSKCVGSPVICCDKAPTHTDRHTVDTLDIKTFLHICPYRLCDISPFVPSEDMNL